MVHNDSQRTQAVSELRSPGGAPAFSIVHLVRCLCVCACVYVSVCLFTVQHLANEVLVKRLAENRTCVVVCVSVCVCVLVLLPSYSLAPSPVLVSFQRFAYKSVETVKSLKDVDAKAAASSIKNHEGAGKVSGFFSQVRAEMVEDFQQMTRRGK